MPKNIVMNFMNKLLIFGLALIVLIIPVDVTAQDLDSATFTLISPSVGTPISGTVESTNFKQLYDSIIGGYTVSSANFDSSGGLQEFILANIPTITCLETSSDSGSTTCTGIPGADGMAAVCSTLGCYDRAKLEIDAQGNPDDTRYTIQVSTTSDFSADISYVNPSSRFLDVGPLDDTFFIPKCEWEGTIISGICGAASATYQSYNVLGLIPETTYYARLSAHQGTDTGGNFTQSDFGPSANTTTQLPELSLDIDIAPDTITSTNPPHQLDLRTFVPDQVTTSTDMIVIRVTTNLLNGAESQVSATNGSLDHTTLSDTIASVSGDLNGLSTGYGLRNDDSNTTEDNPGTIGSVTVSTTPTDYTDAGAADKVGAVGTSKVTLFNSNDLPLDNGIASFKIKVKPGTDVAAGNYQEVLNFVLYGNL